MRIPLFDIDWTLLKGGNRAHTGASAYAMHAIFGVAASPHEVETDGLIDTQILLEVLVLHGMPREEILAAMPALVHAMEEYFLAHDDDGEYVVLPGVPDALRSLGERGIPCGVLTGNLERIGWRKLEKADIRGHFAFGAFGSEALCRVDLIDVARRKYRALHATADVAHGPPAFCIVGDSPRDMACAREGGSAGVGVATGNFAASALYAAGAECVLPSLEDSEKLLGLLLH